MLRDAHSDARTADTCAGSHVLLMAMSRHRAFTLIEIMIVIVVIGILSTVAMLKFAEVKKAAYTSRLKSDLRNFTTAQESYFNQYSVYASDPATLAPNFVPSQGTTLLVTQVSGTGWSATATSAYANVTCALFFGVAPVAPATADGQIACQ